MELQHRNVSPGGATGLEIQRGMDSVQRRGADRWRGGRTVLQRILGADACVDGRVSGGCTLDRVGVRLESSADGST